MNLLKYIFKENSEKLNNLIVKNFYESISKTIQSLTHGVTLQKMIQFKMFINFAFNFFCLIRGVKNNKSLQDMRKYLLKKVDSKEKAIAFRKIILMMIQKHI